MIELKNKKEKVVGWISLIFAFLGIVGWFNNPQFILLLVPTCFSLVFYKTIIKKEELTKEEWIGTAFLYFLIIFVFIIEFLKFFI